MVRRLADIGAEGVLLAGAGRAVLLQIANPSVGHAVAEHSNFTERPLDRLRTTMSYVYAVIYGSPEQLAAMRRSVNRAHAPVRRQAGINSKGYNAFDGDSQLWVVATLYDTAVTVYERIHGPLDDDSADAVYREYAKIGTALQLPEEMWPADRSAFREYWNRSLASMKVDEVAVRVARDLLYPSAVPVWLRLTMPLARLLTAGLLPDSLREDFRLPWGKGRRRRFERTMRLLAVVNPLLPQRVRHWPRDHYLGQIDSVGQAPHSAPPRSIAPSADLRRADA
ncbi:oxygenase MpaB family protein [Arthrobacter sp.]|uniref:oxygenase MpaB family protein n=1 Tax=Arthrobacter sp. TaxID=1667 RepID=UPI002810C9C6|nr:oxygenase MpaB family protein [Arthrobacter sp.]